MTAWKTDETGLAEQEVDKIIEYLTKEMPTIKPDSFDVAEFDGDIQYGEELYRVHCMG